MDLEFDASGNLFVTDRGTGRITTFDPSGKLVASVRFPGGTEVLPFDNDSESWVTLPRTGRADTLWAAFSKIDLTLRSAGTMPPETSFEEDIVGERWAANFPSGDGAVVFFRWSSQMVFLAADGAVQSVVEGIERIPFPQGVVVERVVGDWSVSGFRVDPQAVEATRSVAVGDDRVFVLFLGATNEAGNIVDTYSLNGSYEGSYLLPENVHGSKIAALRDGGFAILDRDFIPTVWVFAE